MKKAVLFILWGIFFLPALAGAVPGYMLARMGTMEGQVFVEGKAAKSVLLTFFNVDKGLPPVANGGIGRIPDVVERSDAEGKFKVQLLQGRYYLGILLRPVDGRPGPPRKGEKFYFADGGQGALRQLEIADFKQSELGRIDCSPPKAFKAVEDHFTVKGVVLLGEGANKPLANAIVLAKTSATAMRPEYFSVPTAKDGKFAINLPPGRTFYLVARSSITGAKPNPGEGVGKLGIDKAAGQGPVSAKNAGPAPPSQEFLAQTGVRGQLNDDSVSVTGKAGEVVSGLKIHMFKMPDGQAIREERQKAAGSGLGQANPGSESGVEFAPNSDQLTPPALAELDGWVQFLQEKKEAKLELGGYELANEAGPSPRVAAEGGAGKNLAERRTEAVKSYLLGKGVGAERINAVSYGPNHEAAAAANMAGKGRVEIKVSN